MKNSVICVCFILFSIRDRAYNEDLDVGFKTLPPGQFLAI